MYRGPVAGEDVAWLDQGKTEGDRGKSWSKRANGGMETVTFGPR